jgi:hypothetical protein
MSELDDTPRYRCNICYKPIGFPPPQATGWTCEEDGGLPTLMSDEDTFNLVDDRELHVLWRLTAVGWESLAKTADGYSMQSRRKRVAERYSKLRPERGSPAAVLKAIERLGIGSPVLTSAQQKLQDQRDRERRR